MGSQHRVTAAASVAILSKAKNIAGCRLGAVLLTGTVVVAAGCSSHKTLDAAPSASVSASPVPPSPAAWQPPAISGPTIVIQNGVFSVEGVPSGADGGLILRPPCQKVTIINMDSVKRNVSGTSFGVENFDRDVEPHSTATFFAPETNGGRLFDKYNPAAGVGILTDMMLPNPWQSCPQS